MDLVESKGNSHRHPWELSRKDVVPTSCMDLISKPEQTVADIGAGDQFFIREVGQFSTTYAIDIEYTGEHLGDGQKIITSNNIASIPAKSLDLVFLLDVLEHVEDEKGFLEEVKSKLKDSGEIIFTVPAYQFLFTQHDVALKHFRRYSPQRLKKVLKDNGIEITSFYQFYSILLPVRLLEVILNKFFPPKEDFEGIGGWKYPIDHPVTKLIVWILNLDAKINRLLNKVGISLPGLSLFARCKIKNS